MKESHTVHCQSYGCFSCLPQYMLELKLSNEYVLTQYRFSVLTEGYLYPNLVNGVGITGLCYFFPINGSPPFGI